MSRDQISSRSMKSFIFKCLKPHQVQLCAKSLRNVISKRKKGTSTKTTKAASEAYNDVKRNSPSIVANRFFFEEKGLKPSEENITKDEDFLISQNFIEEYKSEVSQAYVKKEGTNYKLISENIDNSLEFVSFKEDIRTAASQISPFDGGAKLEVPSSEVPCIGCGAFLQCNDRTMPGFLPYESFALLTSDELKTSICQRCYYIQKCDVFKELSTPPEEYYRIISQIQPKSIVVMVVDLLDIKGSIIPNLLKYIGLGHQLVVVGNKADLIAPDDEHYLESVKNVLLKSLSDSGFVTDECILISAKTGFGIETLISYLFSIYTLNADVYIVGSANAGKSSLFNILLASDYCRQTAKDLIQRATVSTWPGTTLNLLKFPITKPTNRIRLLRSQRLKQEKALQIESTRLRKVKTRTDYKHSNWSLNETVSETDFRDKREKDKYDSAWGQDFVTYNTDELGRTEPVYRNAESKSLDECKYKNSLWAYDTPGIINNEQVMNFLSPNEVSRLNPGNVIVPRCIILYPSSSVFVSGLSRLDYPEGKSYVSLAIHCSEKLPIEVCAFSEADEFYKAHVGTEKLGVPLRNEKNSKLPYLSGKWFCFDGIGHKTAVADIQLSSVGWISIAAAKDEKVNLCAFTPGGIGIDCRLPALLPNWENFRGKRLKSTPFYTTREDSAKFDRDIINPNIPVLKETMLNIQVKKKNRH